MLGNASGPVIGVSNNIMIKKIKYIVKLKQKKYRDQENKFILEGIKNVEEVLKAGLKIFSVLYTEQLFKTKDGGQLYKNIEKNGIEKIAVGEKEFKNISHSLTPQGILAVCQKLNYDFSEISKEKVKSLVILDRIQDPGNLGTIIRTADAVGVSCVIVSKGTVDVYNPKVLSSAMGSIGHIPIVRVDDILIALKKLKKNGIRILSCDVHAEKDYFGISYKYPLGIVFGNEGEGLTKEIINLSDEVVKIPILGKAESLNVGVACGVVLYKMIEKSG